MTLTSQFIRVATPRLVAIAFLICLGGPSPAYAAIETYTITGVVDGANLDTGSYLAPATPPFAGGATFTLVFDLDDATPLGFGSGSFSSYDGAISDFSFTASTGEFMDSPNSSVFEFEDGGAHAWSAVSGDIFQAGFSTNIPDLSLDDGTGSFDTFFLEVGGFELLMQDSLGMLFTMMPPELVVADTTNTDSQTLTLRWGSFFEDTASLPLTIQSITVPEPSSVTLITAGSLFLLWADRRRTAASRI